MKQIILFISLILCVPAAAMTVGDFFVAMPDSLMPYLNKAQRQELISLQQLDNNSNATLPNLFQRNATLLSISDEKMVIKPNDGTIMEILRLPANDGDSLFCLLSTIQLPEEQTQCTIYNKVWQVQQTLDLMGLYTNDSTFLTQCPDTMTQQRYAETLKLIEFPIIAAHITDEPASISVTLSAPYLSKDEKQRLDAILRKRVMGWNGNSFVVR
ncbi:MAG: DUF3256 family protein [Prevotella sp.]|nr:DUF3256 family protein [Candidatus Prevotella equi]